VSDRDALSSEVAAALAAVETAVAPVDPAGYQALRDPALRAEVERALEACGRRLVERDGRFVSGFSDETADWLAGSEHDQLTGDDRAVLTLVLLHTVAIPRARGRVPAGAPWTVAEPVTVDTLALNKRMDKERIRRSVRRLRDLGALPHGHRSDIVPGPQFHRLSEQRLDGLWQRLLLLAAPDSAVADGVRRRLGRPDPQEAS
jgi:hypothetical protein